VAAEPWAQRADPFDGRSGTLSQERIAMATAGHWSTALRPWPPPAR
jgi:hypothetical protein